MIVIRRSLLLLIATFIILIAIPIPAAAQAPITLDTLTITFWPEFDQPSMLVFYTGTVAGETGQVDLTFTLPAGASLNAAAYVDPATGTFLTAPSHIDGSKVTLTSPNGTFRLEFYDPALDTSKANRSYSYTWRGDYAVNTLTWIVQQPPSALNMRLDPAATDTTDGDFGLTYQVVTVGKVDQGKTATLKISYDKANSTLTSELLPEATQAPTPSGSGTSGSILPIVLLVVLSIGVIGGGAYLYMRRKAATDRAGTRKGSRRSTRSVAQASKQQAAPTRFCTQCGTQALDASDKFCRKCGAALR